jgi:hypothetical protein
VGSAEIDNSILRSVGRPLSPQFLGLCLSICEDSLAILQCASIVVASHHSATEPAAGIPGGRSPQSRAAAQSTMFLVSSVRQSTRETNSGAASDQRSRSGCLGRHDDASPASAVDCARRPRGVRVRADQLPDGRRVAPRCGSRQRFSRKPKLSAYQERHLDRRLFARRVLQGVVRRAGVYQSVNRLENGSSDSSDHDALHFHIHRNSPPSAAWPRPRNAKADSAGLFSLLRRSCTVRLVHLRTVGVMRRSKRFKDHDYRCPAISAPASVNRTVGKRTPKRLDNAGYRTREHPTPGEVTSSPTPPSITGMACATPR